MQFDAFYMLIALDAVMENDEFSYLFLKLENQFEQLSVI